METSLSTIKEIGEIIELNSEDKKYLPEEIVTDIISRLSVKPVFQLQGLSKNFSSITKNLNFIDAHLRHSAQLRPSIIVNTGLNIFLIQSNRLDSEITVEKVQLHQMIGFADLNKKIKLVGSCNGLVLVVMDHIFLLNPVTVKYDHLPRITNAPGSLVKAAWGFGYCAESNVYKIVRIASYYPTYYLPPYSDCELLLSVLTCGSDRAWRRVDSSITIDQMCDEHGITVNGVVYWNPVPAEHNHYKLLTFDLEIEEFAWIFCPVSMNGQIMEFRGSLAVCVNSEDNINVFDIWVLKDKDCCVNENSWEKIYSTDEISSCKPLLWLNDRHLLLLNGRNEFLGKKLSLYDLESKEMNDIAELSLFTRFQALDFAESLVPLPTIGNDSQYDSNENGQECWKCYWEE